MTREWRSVTITIQIIVFRKKKYRTMEHQKRSKGSGWECCYAKKKFGTFGVEMRACGQKLVKFCTHIHTHTHTHTHTRAHARARAAKLVGEIQINVLDVRHAGKTQIELRGHGSTEKLRCDGLICQ